MGQQSPFREDTLQGKASAGAALPMFSGSDASVVQPTYDMQVAFVTGGGSGIGFEIARQLGDVAVWSNSSADRTSAVSWLRDDL